jgi:hypothetical protein
VFLEHAPACAQKQLINQSSKRKQTKNDSEEEEVNAYVGHEF